MGRSKFPGKPSRSVKKSRMRVLNKNEVNRRIDKRNYEAWSSSNNSFNPNTRTGNQVFKESNVGKANIKVQKSSGSSSSKSGEDTLNEGFEKCDDKSQRFKQDHTSDHREKGQDNIMPPSGNCHENSKLNSACRTKLLSSRKRASECNHSKKKTVTFKSILETSDDLSISRSIHNPLNKGPLVSIMKKDCIKSQGYMARKDRIVLPSRLTKILKNNENIDKTKYLSFRTVQLPKSESNTNETDKQDDNCSSSTEESGRKSEMKLKDQDEEADVAEDRFTDMLGKWDVQKFGPYTENYKIRSDCSGSCSKNKSLNKIQDEKCSACWLKNCIKTFQFPSRHKLFLNSLISKTQNKDVQTTLSKTQETFHFKNGIDLLSEQNTTNYQLNLFSWKRTISTNGNGTEQLAKTQQERSLLDKNSLENFVQDNIDSDLFSKSKRRVGTKAKLNFVLNKNPPAAITNKSTDFKASSITTSEYSKRQTIVFRGPRVKHVCRSASIALGQQLATFSSNNDESLELLQIEPGNENNSFINLPEQMEPDEKQIQMQIQPKIQEEPCENIEGNIFQNTNGPTAKSEERNELFAEEVKTGQNMYQNLEQACSDNNNLFTPTFSSNTCSSAKRNLMRVKNVVRSANKPNMISIDFWDTYDPTEVSQNGFGLILTQPSSVFALCFLCGSMDINDLIFCVCCCEPYHSYCVQEAYPESTEFVDSKIAANKFSNKLNWICPRCTVCQTCNMPSGGEIKCQKCKKNYHNTCIGKSKGLLGADRPVICSSCLKCQFCSATKVSKYIGSQPTCIQCYNQRYSDRICSFCNKCFDIIVDVLKCAVCNELIHAKCEGLTEEQINLSNSITDNINFVCNKCSLSNANCEVLARQWREAVCRQLKIRLLQVLKQLSKSRSANLLKKSLETCSQCGFNKSTNNNLSKKDSNGCYKYKLNNIIESTFQSKCLCPPRSSILQQKSNLFSLLDIKKKIVNGDYVSLFDFNVDMNDVIMPLKNDELILIYKEIITEKFPWFQNETKTCTDALEEDMFDSCNNIFDTEDDTVRDINIPTFPSFEENMYTSFKQNMDKRVCIFCLKEGDCETLQESRLLYYGFDSWVHVNCALWSMDVFEDFDGSLQNVHNAFIKGKYIRCSLCGNQGATVKCNVKVCRNYYHFRCARKVDCLFEYETSIFCPLHKTGRTTNSNEILSILRPLHIECTKSHKKYVEPHKVQFMLGSLSVIQLGSIYLPFSDTTEAIVPINFVCTRLYWSSKEPWKIIKYRVRTSIQNSPTTIINEQEQERNITVDHSKNRRLIEKDLSQISRWYNTLIRDDNSESSLNNEDGYLNNLRYSKNVDFRSDTPSNTLSEDEPQNNSDLLPPEIEEAILEDLPNDILDGISMLDIFPKLMVHKGLDGIEGKLYKNNEFSESSEPLQPQQQPQIDCVSFNSLKKQNSKYISQKRERQTHKNVNDHKSQQNTFNVAWTTENRKFSRNIFDLNFDEKRAFNVNPVQFEKNDGESKFNSKKTTYSEKNKSCSQFMRENIKLMQLDGADDQFSGFLNSLIQQKPSKAPVKCDRCHCTYRTLYSFQRHFLNCEQQLSTSESETDNSFRTVDSKNSMVVLKDTVSGDTSYQIRFARNQNVSANVKQTTNFTSSSAESIIPQKTVNVNFFNNVNGMDENITCNQSSINNTTIKTEQGKLFPEIKNHALIAPIKTNKTAYDLQDSNNYLQLLNKNLMLTDQFSQKEQQQNQQQQQFVIVQHSAENSQPMFIHQAANATPTVPQNIFPVVLPNNSVQYASVPTFTNSIMPAPMWHNDCNVMLSSGLYMFHMPSLQLDSSYPPLVGSFNMPQPFQLESNQVLLGGTPTVDSIPNVNQWVLAPQPVFYGVETIVQNTIMSSQQFVSTALQGVLSQNASISATTTQVFQSSKFEPVSDAHNNYVVLNNVDGSTLVVPQMKMLPPGYFNANNSQDFHSSYNASYGNINGTPDPAIIQQTEPSNNFTRIQTFPEITNTPIKIPPTEMKEIIRFDASSNQQTNNKNSLNKILLENNTINQEDNDKTNISSSFVSYNNFSNTNYADYIEVQTPSPEIKGSTKQKMEISSGNTKRKNESLAFSQIGLKIMYKNMLKKKTNSNLKIADQERISESPVNKTKINYDLTSESIVGSSTSATRTINKTNSQINHQTSRDQGEILKPINSDWHSFKSNTLNRLESRKVNLSSTKLPTTTPSSFGNGLHNVPTNIVVPIMQAKESDQTSSRPTNRVLPMQSIHKPVEVSKPKNKHFINEFVENSGKLQAKIFQPIPIGKKEELDAFSPVKEVEKESYTENVSKNNVSTSTNTISEEYNTDIYQKEHRNSIEDSSSVEIEKVFSSLNVEKKLRNLESPNPDVKENILEIQNLEEKEDMKGSYGSEEMILRCPSNDDFSGGIDSNGIEKCTNELRSEKEFHETELDSINKAIDPEYLSQSDSGKSNSPVNVMSRHFKIDDQKPIIAFPVKKPFKVETIKKNLQPHLIFEIQSEDGFSYKSESISDIWENVFEAVQRSRRAYGLPSYPKESFTEISGIQILGLKTQALKYLIEQLPGIERCQWYTPKDDVNGSSNVDNVYSSNKESLNSNICDAARCEPFAKRVNYDMFSWLASKHRKQPKQIFVQPSETELIPRRCTGNLPMAMKYRTLKETCKLNVGVFRSNIHGRGLFCIKDMEAGEMVIEYAGELIRSTLADKRERLYENKGIGCYMFKIEEHFVVDATMRGNAARFINHSCEPNCYSKVVDILGHKHIIIFSLRRIVQGEELTYDYKFPFEDVKINCYCASKKCRKYLN